MNATNSKAITDIMSAKTPTHMPRPCLQLIMRGRLFAAVLLAVTLSAINGQSAENTTSKATCIDLSKHFTAQLTNSLNSPSSVTENNLATLPKGRQVFSGVPFVVGGLLQLSGKKLQEWGRSEYPESITGIKLGKRCQRLHLLHGAGGVFDPEDVTIAKLVLHYSDKSMREIDIKTGVHIRDWWGDPKQEVTGKNSELAWTGTNPALKQYGGNHPGSLRIYKTTFENPQPGTTITAIDYVSTMHNSSPFLIGLTIE